MNSEFGSVSLRTLLIDREPGVILRLTAVLGGEPSAASGATTARAVDVADCAKIVSSSSNWSRRAMTSRSVIGGVKTRVQPALVLIELDLFGAATQRAGDGRLLFGL